MVSSEGDCNQTNLEQRLEGEADQVPLAGGVQAELWAAQCCSVLQHGGVLEGLSVNTADIGHQVGVVTVGVVVNSRYCWQDAQVGVLYDENIL